MKRRLGALAAIAVLAACGDTIINNYLPPSSSDGGVQGVSDAGTDVVVGDASDAANANDGGAAAQDAGDGATRDASDASDASDAREASDASDASDGAVAQDAGDAGASRILVSATSGTTSESGATFTFTVALSAQPAATVTCGVTSSDAAEGTVSPASLTFTQANWSTPQTVTVTGVADGVWDYDRTYAINFAPSVSSDPSWNGIAALPVAMTNTDVDLPAVQLVSKGASGSNGQSGGQSATGVFLGGPSATNDGAVFASEASNFANGDTNGAADVFMWGAGAPLVISGSSAFNNGAGGVCNGQSTQPVAASADRYVAYRTTCTGPAPWATAGCILQHTFSGTVYQLSTSTSCVLYDMSSDGRYALFTEPVSGVTTLKRFDRTSSTSTTLTALGTPTSAAISRDGRYVTFLSTNAFDAADTNGANDLYLVDMNSPSTFTRISKKSDGSQLPNGVTAGGISGDGAYAWFVTADVAESADTDTSADLYIAQRGVTGSTTLASRMATSGAVGLADISDSGQYLAFEFTPSGGDKGVWVYDRVKQTNKSVHKTSTGGTPNGITELPSISADGKYIAYVGWASNLVSGDTNGKADIFRVVRP